MRTPELSAEQVESAVLVQARAVVSARGMTTESLLAEVQEGRRFEPAKHRQLETEALLSRARLSSVEARRLDRFSLLALAAVSEVLSSYPLSAEARWHCGLLVGNTMAGWTFTEPQLRVLYGQGAPVSPFMATAWFPAAAQGHVTLAMGMHGHSKTVTTDRCSGGQAIGWGLHRLLQGGQGPFVAGGSEAPVTPLVRAVLEDAGVDWVPWLSEAAGFLLLTRGVEASEGACVLRAHTSFRRVRPERTEAGLAEFLEGMEGTPPLAAVVCDARPASEDEQALETLVQRRLGATVPRLWPCRTLGDSLGAGSGVAMALACELLARESAARSVLVLSLGEQCVDVSWLHS
ncbi:MULTISPECIES: beta-ketoacyl synthase N-terminal-like domain-containing protein [unclassified Corallococcus]|uniref:beta-ketoacyl synthase N-terminal-like domain-containing protein n=1 Tax=unclassified Corallococcus TaxID=2685029 RepID=UPI001A8ED712|nr:MULTISPECIES: beta-ketoacyl synthase N-terminal-like domain-containing protein [unclassified Corallococcus]MBN9684646.1 hypothetical protein [Corallococcus sp. NCSPR001]WAS83883.1 beta-ketoacyl synthase N-terminal-like domain-containing protein [Corallococcus sp. NCRR]